MFVVVVMTVVCTAGIVFYVRFLFALCKECTPYWTDGHKAYLEAVDLGYIPLRSNLIVCGISNTNRERGNPSCLYELFYGLFSPVLFAVISNESWLVRVSLSRKVGCA